MEEYNRRFLKNILKFSSYRPKYMLIRIAFMALLGILLCHLAVKVTDVPADKLDRIFDFYPIVIISFGIMSEANLMVIKILNMFEGTRWNIIILPIGMACVSAFLMYIIRTYLKYYLTDPSIINHSVFNLMNVFMVMLVFILFFCIIIVQLSSRWMESEKEIDELKSAKLQSDYNSLQDRLNPHFLFNNLSVLKSLIRYDSNVAETFIDNFTDVYRYVLKSRDHHTISVAREMEFVEAYVGLQRERLGEGLIINMNLDPSILNNEVPPMAIQALVENAVKHNRISRKHPLKIDVENTSNSIEVRNTLARKETTYSTQTGMKTLRMQFELLGAGEVIVSENDTEYSVTIPVL